MFYSVNHWMNKLFIKNDFLYATVRINGILNGQLYFPLLFRLVAFPRCSGRKRCSGCEELLSILWKISLLRHAKILCDSYSSRTIPHRFAVLAIESNFLISSWLIFEKRVEQYVIRLKIHALNNVLSWEKLHPAKRRHFNKYRCLKHVETTFLMCFCCLKSDWNI